MSAMNINDDPRMKPYWDRLHWDYDHLWDFSSYNPFVLAGEGDSLPKHRTGLQDVTHAIKNIWVEWSRLKKEDDDER